MSSMMVDGLTKSSTSSGPQVRMIAAVPSWPSLTISTRLRVDHRLDVDCRLDLEEVVEPGMADQLGVDDVAAEGADAVEVALGDVLDDEARDVVVEQVVADPPVGERAGDQVGRVGRSLSPAPWAGDTGSSRWHRRDEPSRRRHFDGERVVVEQGRAGIDVGGEDLGAAARLENGVVQPHDQRVGIESRRSRAPLRR